MLNSSSAARFSVSMSFQSSRRLARLSRHGSSLCWRTTSCLSIVAGVTPDGAADGQCGLAKIETIAEKVDTCMLHVLQRAVLFSIGIAGASSKNPEAKWLLRANNRVVQLSRRSLAVGKSISNAQVAANVPHEKVLSLVKTATTRWGNQYSQLSTNKASEGHRSRSRQVQARKSQQQRGNCRGERVGPGQQGWPPSTCSGPWPHHTGMGGY